MEDGNICFTCQDFEKKVGQATKWCPKNVCQKCGQNGHVKMGCMFGLEDFPLPNEIILQTLGYLHVKDLEQCAKVSKRFKEICDIRKLDEKRTLQSLLNTIFAQPTQQSKAWHGSVTPDLRNHILNKL